MILRNTGSSRNAVSVVSIGAAHVFSSIPVPVGFMLRRRNKITNESGALIFRGRGRPTERLHDT